MALALRLRGRGMLAWRNRKSAIPNDQSQITNYKSSMARLLQPHADSKNLSVQVVPRDRSSEFHLGKERGILQGRDQLRRVIGKAVHFHHIFANAQFLEPGAVRQQLRQLL